MPEPTAAVDPVDRLGLDLVAATRRVARAVADHEKAKAAYDAAKREMEAAEEARGEIRDRLERVLYDEAHGKGYSPVVDLAF